METTTIEQSSFLRWLSSKQVDLGWQIAIFLRNVAISLSEYFSQLTTQLMSFTLNEFKSFHHLFSNWIIFESKVEAISFKLNSFLTPKAVDSRSVAFADTI